MAKTASLLRDLGRSFGVQMYVIRSLTVDSRSQEGKILRLRTKREAYLLGSSNRCKANLSAPECFHFSAQRTIY